MSYEASVVEEALKKIAGSSSFPDCRGKKILVNLSGRGDKDIDFVMEHYPLTEYEPGEKEKDGGYEEFLRHIGGERS